MTKLQEAVRAVQGAFGTKQNKIEWQIATLGNGKGQVVDSDNKYFVRLKEK